MNDDAALLRRYAEEGSEAAFAELVRRYVDLVYGAAQRRTGDAHRAAEVAQQVFTTLARDARKLSRHPALGAWLHTATRNAALNLMISEQRRQEREFKALALEPAVATSGADPDWERLRPVLDTAIDELPEVDRAAVVLRFLERRAFAEIGAVLHVSEDAARMRTDRALDKLRTVLARRGITSTAAALGAIVSSQPLVAAPAGLAAALASTSLTTAGASGGLLASLTLFMSTKIVTTVVITALIFFGLGSYVGLKQTADAPSPPRLEAPLPSPTITSLEQANQSLKAEVERMKKEIEQLDAVNAHLTAQLAVPPPAPAPKSATLGWMPRYEQQRMIMNSLRQIAAARDQFLIDQARAPASIDELVGLGRYLKTVRPVGGEDYSSLSMASGQPLSVTTADGMTVIFDPSGIGTTPIETPPAVVHADELSQKMAPAIQKATEAYRLANPETKSRPNPETLMNYFATAEERAAFVEMIEAQKASFAAQKAAPR